MITDEVRPPTLLEAIQDRLAGLGLRDAGWRCDPHFKDRAAVVLSFRGAWRACDPEKLLNLMGRHTRRDLNLNLWQLSKEAEVAA